MNRLRGVLRALIWAGRKTDGRSWCVERRIAATGARQQILRADMWKAVIDVVEHTLNPGIDRVLVMETYWTASDRSDARTRVVFRADLAVRAKGLTRA